jgi:putative colanic acid biosynthesis acetyltransferase WcaF
MSYTQTRLDSFDPRTGFSRGRSVYVFAAWYLAKRLFFLSSIPWPYRLKAFILRLFGAKVGTNVLIKPRVNIHYPWNLVLGSNVWIGEEVLILDFEQIAIGSNVCLSQQVFLCSGSHNFRDPSFSYRNAPISIGDGVWLQARVFVCPGVKIGAECVVYSTSLVKDSLLANHTYAGNPARDIGLRWRVESELQY